MSYTVRIWEPSPTAALTSLEAVVEQLAALDKDLRAQHANPKFITLSQHLNEAWGLAGQAKAKIKAEPDLDTLPWRDWPLHPETAAGVWNLGLNQALLTQTLPVLIQAARALGLAVLDEQQAQAYLPGGETLTAAPPPNQAPITATTDTTAGVPKNRDALSRIYDVLAPWFKKHGFRGRKSTHTFRRTFPGGWHEVYLDSGANYWPVSARVLVGACVRLDVISERVASISYTDRPLAESAESATLLCHSKRWIKQDAPFVTTNEYEISNFSQIEQVAAHLQTHLEALLPHLDRCQTLADFDREMNGPERENSVFSPYNDCGERVIAAYLNHNPQLDALCSALEIDPSTRYGTKVQACIRYVREHPLT
ncbi:hypothetical protein [Zoogloea sp.]|uniref:hypothetical protein n=1 Tax=Zoogloea sp. TaxID=49181 RepID=UPI0035B1414A